MSKMKFSKKMVYSTLAAIGLVGSTGGIIGGVVTNNNLQTSQTITNLDNQINNINLYDTSANTNTSNQTNSNVDTSNADTYNIEFLKDLNNYKNVDYTTTFSQNNNVDSQYNTDFSDTNNAVLGYNGDLTTNSVLNTKKDSAEISNESKGNLDSNLYNTLKNAMIDFRHEWFNELDSKINNLINNYNNDFIVNSISTIMQYANINWYGEVSSHFGNLLHCLGWDFDNLNPFNSDPNDNNVGYFTSSGFTSHNYYYNDLKFGILQNPTNVNTRDNRTLGFSGPSYESGFVGVTPSVDGGEINSQIFETTAPYVTKHGNDFGWSFTKWGWDCLDSSSFFPWYDYYNYYVQPEDSAEDVSSWGGLYQYSEDKYGKRDIGSVVGLIDQNVNFINTYTFPTNLLNFTPNSISTLRTNPNNKLFADWIDFSPECCYWYDYYRGLLEWTLEKLPIYSFDPNTYEFNVDNKAIINTKGDIDTSNSDLFLNNPYNFKFFFDQNGNIENDWDAKDLYIKGSGDQKVSNDFYNYYNQRSQAEQDVLDLYKNAQLKNIVQQINNDKNNFTVSNLTGSDGVQIVDGSSTNGKNYSDSQVFGSNTPFTISKITLPQQFNTNYGAFITTINNTNNSNSIYLFNNFLPVLASQIVVDPTSALSSYTNPNSTTGVYTNQLDNTHGELKFKLSENFGQLLSIANIYSTYKNLIEGLNPNNYGLENSQNYNAINNLKNNFENLNFTNNQVSLLNDLQSNIGDKNKVVSDANALNTQVINNQNSTNLLNLVSKIFNCDPNILIDSNGNLTNDIKQTLVLLPTATQNAMSNLDIVANISYGDGKSIVSNDSSLEAPDKDGIIIWNASDTKNNNQGTFEPISIDDAFNNTTNYNLKGNNDVEINVSNIHFEYKDGSTIKDTNDAYTDNMNFINNGVNNNLDYMLNEYNSYYPNNSSISVNDATNTLTYKLHYNPSYADYGLSNPDQYIVTQGIPITDKTDANGVTASDYSTTNINVKTIDNAIQNFFTAQIADKEILQLDSTTTKVIKTMNDVDATYKTTIEQITNNNVTPNDTTGNFYAIVTITNSQNFSNPTGSGNANNQISMDDGTLVPMWYLSENTNNTQQRTYLVEMNASKKDVNLSQISFESGTSGDNTITWKMTYPSNYYYNDGTNSSSISLDANGNIEQNQTITINSTNYINLINNIDSDASSASYLNFKSTLSMWFYNNYQKTVSSYTINNLGDNNYTINVILNM